MDTAVRIAATLQPKPARSDLTHSYRVLVTSRTSRLSRLVAVYLCLPWPFAHRITSTACTKYNHPSHPVPLALASGSISASFHFTSGHGSVLWSSHPRLPKSSIIVGSSAVVLNNRLVGWSLSKITLRRRRHARISSLLPLPFAVVSGLTSMPLPHITYCKGTHTRTQVHRHTVGIQLRINRP